MDSEDEDEQSFSPKTANIPINIIISEGNKYLRLLLFEKAISSFQLILDRDSDNTKALMGRAKAYMRLSKYKDAWQDFQHVVNINPKCTEAIYLKGVTEYLRGDFEKGLNTYWEGSKVHSSREQLRHGHQMCQKAIENNLETPMQLTGEDTIKMHKLLHKDIIMAENNDNYETYEKKGLFSKDLQFLEEMLKDRNLASIHSISEDVFNYLRERQKFWKMQAPQINRRLRDSINIRNNIRSPQMKNNLICQLEICELALKDGKIDLCLNKGNELLETLDNISPEYFPVKNEIEASTLHLLALACSIKGNLSSAMEFCEVQLSIARNNNMSDIEGRALRDMGEIYLKDREYERACNCFLQSLEFTEDEKEEAILYYKISDCKIHLDDLNNAKNAARKCLDFAMKSEDTRFRFDAVLLLAEITVKNKEMKVAEQYYRDALDIAIHSQDSRRKDIENILEFFQEARGKNSYSDERIKIVKITDEIKQGTTVNDRNFQNNLICQLQICKSALKDGKMKLCLDKGSELLETLSNFSSEYIPEKNEIETSTLHLLTLASLEEGNISSAIEFCEAQLGIAKNNCMSVIEGRALRDMGEIYLKNGKHDKASSYFQQSLEFAATKKEEAILYYKISDCKIHLNDFESAKTAAHKCLDFAVKSEDPRFRFDTVLLLAEIAVKNKDMEVAERFYRDALEIAIHSQDSRRIYIENILEIFEETTGKKSYSDERVKIVKITDGIRQDTNEIYRNSQNNLIRQLEICKSALKDGEIELCLTKGSELIEELRNFSSECIPEKKEIETSTLHLLTLACLKEGEISSAKGYCETQLNIARNNEMPDIEGRALRDMGEIYQQNCEHERASSCFQQSIEFATSPKEEAILYYKISDCKINLNELNSAKIAARKCLDYATEFEDPRLHFDAVLLLAEIAVKNKDMEVGEQFYKNALEIAIHNQDSRQKDIENLLKIFEEETGKKSYSIERVKILKITDEIKHS